MVWSNRLVFFFFFFSFCVCSPLLPRLSLFFSLLFCPINFFLISRSISFFSLLFCPINFFSIARFILTISRAPFCRIIAASRSVGSTTAQRPDSLASCPLFTAAQHEELVALAGSVGADFSTVALPTRWAAAFKTALLQVSDQAAVAVLRAQLVRLGAVALLDKLLDANNKVKAGFQPLLRHITKVSLYGSVAAVQNKAALLVASKVKQWQAAQEEGASDSGSAAAEAEEERARAVAAICNDALAVCVQKIGTRDYVVLLSAAQSMWL